MVIRTKYSEEFYPDEILDNVRELLTFASEKEWSSERLRYIAKITLELCEED